MNDEYGDTQERGEAARRRGEEQVARLRQALAEATQQAEQAARERRERTTPLRRGAP